jgi:hypothetical protein
LYTEKKDSVCGVRNNFVRERVSLRVSLFSSFVNLAWCLERGIVEREAEGVDASIFAFLMQ